MSQQTQDTGTNFFGANPNAPPLQLANDSEDMQRALRRRAEHMRSGCRPSRITFPSSQKSITALIDSDTEWDCFIIVVLAVL